MCLKPVITFLLIGLIGVAACGGKVVVDAEGGGEGGAGGLSSGSLTTSAGSLNSGSNTSGTGQVSSVGSMSGVAVTSGTSGPGVSVTSGPSGPSGPNTTTTGGTGVVCGMESCYPVDVMGFITLDPCCPDTNPNKCGLDVSAIASFVGFPPGCMEVARPGNLDASCPDKLLNVMGMMVTLPGCCSGGMCGVFADFSSFAPGMNFGCADASDVTQSCGP